METVPYSLRIPKKVIELADLRTKEEQVDTSTALGQFLYIGAQNYVIELYLKGKISLSKAADLLDMSTFDILKLTKEHSLPGLTEVQLESSRKTAKTLTV